MNHFPCWHQKSFHLLLRSFHLFGSIDFTYSFGSLIPTRIKVVSPTLQIVSPTLRIVDSCLDQWFHLLLRSFHLLFGSSIPAWIKVVSPTPRIVSPTLRIVDSCLDQKWYHLLCGSMDFTYSSDRRLPLGSVVSPTLRIFVFHLLFGSFHLPFGSFNSPTLRIHFARSYQVISPLQIVSPTLQILDSFHRVTTLTVDKG